MSASFSALPDVTQSHILSYLSYNELLKCERVCQLWKKLSVPRWQAWVREMYVTLSQMGFSENEKKWKKITCNVKRLSYTSYDAPNLTFDQPNINLLAIAGCRLFFSSLSEYHFLNSQFIQMYDCRTEKTIYAFVENKTTALTFFQERIFTGNRDGIIKIWNADNFSSIHEFKAHKYPIEDLKALDKRLASQTNRNIIRLWDLESCTCIQEFNGCLIKTNEDDFIFSNMEGFHIVNPCDGVVQNRYFLNERNFYYNTAIYFAGNWVFLTDNSLVICNGTKSTDEYDAELSSRLYNTTGKSDSTHSDWEKETLTSIDRLGDKLILGTSFGKIRVFDLETKKFHILYEPFFDCEKPKLNVAVSAHMIAFQHQKEDTIKIIELSPKQKKASFFSSLFHSLRNGLQAVNRFMDQPISK